MIASIVLPVVVVEVAFIAPTIIKERQAHARVVAKHTDDRSEISLSRLIFIIWRVMEQVPECSGYAHRPSVAPSISCAPNGRRAPSTAYRNTSRLEGASFLREDRPQQARGGEVQFAGQLRWRGDGGDFTADGQALFDVGEHEADHGIAAAFAHRARDQQFATEGGVERAQAARFVLAGSSTVITSPLCSSPNERANAAATSFAAVASAGDDCTSRIISFFGAAGVEGAANVTVEN